MSEKNKVVVAVIPGVTYKDATKIAKGILQATQKSVKDCHGTIAIAPTEAVGKIISNGSKSNKGLTIKKVKDKKDKGGK